MRFNRFGHRKMYRVATSVAALGFLSACSVPGMVIGAGATAGIAAAEERGVETALDDLQIDVEIKRQFLELDENLLAAISTEVHDGRVLLTGVVDEPEMRMTAARLSWGVDGVAEVINEIKVAGDASIAQASKDIFISTELRARLMGDGDVSAINYSIETVRGTVYLLGIARTQGELQRVINHARNVSGVRNIVPYVRVKPAEQDQPV
ncbi:MAG: BON domain-containing protein [Rhodobiaceae bacterium]|nr:BON domain-containing protein [Rhodobiaceae bacterium]